MHMVLFCSKLLKSNANVISYLNVFTCAFTKHISTVNVTQGYNIVGDVHALSCIILERKWGAEEKNERPFLLQQLL